MRNVSISIDLYDYPLYDLTLKQYDTTSLQMLIYENKEPYNLDGLSATLNAVTPDNRAVVIQKDIEITLPNTITVTLADEVTALPGSVQFELVIMKNGKQISTYAFQGNIERSPIGSDTPVVWEDVSGNIYKALALANIASEKLKEQTAEATDISDNLEMYLNAIEVALAKMAEYDANAANSMREAAESAMKSLESADDAYRSQKAAEKARDEITEMHDTVIIESREVAENLTEVERLTAHVDEVSANTDNVIATVLGDAEYAKNTSDTANKTSQENMYELEEIRKYLLENKIDANDLGLVQDPVTKFVHVTLWGVESEIGIPLAGGTGGGGGGGSFTYVITLKNLLPDRNVTIAEGVPAILKFSYASVDEDGVDDGNGVCTVYVGSVPKVAFNIPQDDNSIDISKYLASGENKVNIKVENSEGSSKLLTYTVNVISLSMSTTLDMFSTNSGSVTFYYTPTGAGDKTVHFIMDGTEIGTAEIKSSGRSQTYIIPAQSHGGHIFEAYADMTVGDITVRSNTITLGMLWVDKSNMTPIIVSTFDVTSATQGETLTIPYMAYDPSTESALVTLSIINSDGTVYNTQSLTVNRTAQEWVLQDYPVGNVTFKISLGAVFIKKEVSVMPSGIVIETITDSLAFAFSAAGRSNNEANPAQWTDGNVSATFSDVSFLGADGWLTDSNGGSMLRLLPGGKMFIPFKLFETDKRISGATIEIEMATQNVRDYDSTVIECSSGDRGFKIASQSAEYKSEQSTVSMMFKEDSRVRVSFVIEPRNLNRLIYVYINGIMSGAIQYPDNDNFAQSPPVGITIGAESSGIDVYRILLYNKGLTRNEILNNYTADRTTLRERLDTYERNNLLNVSETIDISKLPATLPYMLIRCPELPQYKGDKKTCEITYVNPADTSKSFTASGVQIDVQGTSSAGYKKKNFKISMKSGLTYTADNTQATGYKLKNNSIPVNVFTMKADVASSEGFNNVGLVGVYNDTSPYKTDAQKADPRCRVGIDGVPCVIFWQNSITNEVKFWGKYNFNNDKANEIVFGLVPGCESWEIKNNTSDRVIFKKSDYTTDEWLNDFEARYPEDNTDYTNLKRLTDWLVSTDRSAVSSDADKLARLNKFKSEFTDYFVKDATLFYYLFTEVFLMVDSRAKNFFPSTYDGTHWMPLPYDMDTAVGINNEGQLVFGYGLEDTDKVDDANVYNGQESVLWCNVRDAFESDLKAMYANLRNGNLFNYSEIMRRYTEHQIVWPEVVWNEDAYEKYLEPLINDNDGSYLTMLQGSKASQRDWWLYNGFRYRDSKYQTGDASLMFVTLRCYAVGDITVTPYIDIYPRVKYGSYTVSQRGKRNVPQTLVCPLDNMNDTEVYIYSADCLAAIGDLSHLQVGYANFSMATKLQLLKLGDSSVGYQNTRLTDLYVGNNDLLTEVDVTNCINLAQTVDLSGCDGIETIKANGSSVTGFNLPVGGKLATLMLPGTITNLTIRDQIRFQSLQLQGTNALTTLRLENTPNIPVETIILSAPALDRVRLIDMEWTATNETALQATITKLKTCIGLDASGNNTPSAVVTGRVYVSSISAGLLTEISETFPQLIVVANGVPQYVVRYLNYDGIVLYRMVVAEGANVVNAVTAGYITAPTIPGTEDTGYQFKDFGTLPTDVHSNITVIAQYVATYRVLFMNGEAVYNTQWIESGKDAVKPSGTPTKPSTQQYTYTFSGWDKAYTNITAPLIVNAMYTSVGTKYTVYFYNGTTLLQTKTQVEYGTSVTYTGATPVSPDGSAEDFPFEGWMPPPTNITGNTSCYAQFGSPLRVEEITDTWEQIIQAVNNGTAKDKYAIGNYKPLDLGVEGIVNMQIVGKNVDNLADGSGTAMLTWLSREVLNTSRRMNPTVLGTSPNLAEGTGMIGGWEKSELRAYMKNTIKPLIPESVQSAIKTISKAQPASDTLGEIFTQTSEEDVWIPSYAEMFNLSGGINQPRYKVVFPDNVSRIKKKVGGSATNWWLRTTYIYYAPMFVLTSGSQSNSYSGSTVVSLFGVSLGFCL